MAHTPGPWRFGLRLAEYNSTGPNGEEWTFQAASIGANNGAGPQMAIIPMDESSMENGALISAAPDLLQAAIFAAQIMTKEMPTLAEHNTAARHLIAAIKKAQGF